MSYAKGREPSPMMCDVPDDLWLEQERLRAAEADEEREERLVDSPPPSPNDALRVQLERLASAEEVSESTIDEVLCDWREREEASRPFEPEEDNPDRI